MLLLLLLLLLAVVVLIVVPLPLPPLPTGVGLGDAAGGDIDLGRPDAVAREYEFVGRPETETGRL